MKRERGRGVMDGCNRTSRGRREREGERKRQQRWRDVGERNEREIER